MGKVKIYCSRIINHNTGEYKDYFITPTLNKILKEYPHWKDDVIISHSNKGTYDILSKPDGSEILNNTRSKKCYMFLYYPDEERIIKLKTINNCYSI